MIESIIIGIVFLAAVGYLLNVVRKQFSTKDAGCAKGCGCSMPDTKKVEMKSPKKEQVA